MALLLPNSAFIHCRKTGGSWIRSVLKSHWPDAPETGEGLGPSERIHATFAGVRSEVGSRKAFGFVRHPLSWLKSYWAFRQIRGWDSDRDIDNLPGRDNLDMWLVQLVHERPGWVGRNYQRVLRGCTVLGRTEDLPVSLIQVLRICEPADAEKVAGLIGDRIAGYGVVNSTGSKDYYVRESTVKAVVQAEASAIEMWERLLIW